MTGLTGGLGIRTEWQMTDDQRRVRVALWLSRRDALRDANGAAARYTFGM